MPTGGVDDLGVWKSAHVGDGEITNAKVKTNTMVEDNFADGAATPDKLSGDNVSGMGCANLSGGFDSAGNANRNHGVGPAGVGRQIVIVNRLNPDYAVFIVGTSSTSISLAQSGVLYPSYEMAGC